MGRSDAAPIEHVFVDLNDRLPSDVRSLLDSLEPGDDATDDERLGAYSSMQQILKVNARRCLHPDAVVPCARCNHDCPVFPQSLTADRSWASPSTEPRAKRRRAAGHSEKPWWFNFGSNECVGVSSMGHRRQSADASMRSFSIWSTERVEVGEDVVFQEWTHLGDTAVLDCAFSPRFRRITVETNPRKRKWGLNRKRSCSALVNGASAIWVGAETEDEIQREYDLMFGNIAIVGNDAPVYAQEARGVADAFFLGVDDRLLFAKKLANHRRKHIRKQTSANTIDWAAVLPAGAAINLR